LSRASQKIPIDDSLLPLHIGASLGKITLSGSDCVRQKETKTAVLERGEDYIKCEIEDISQLMYV
jgi:hypothetical protein